MNILIPPELSEVRNEVLLDFENWFRQEEESMKRANPNPVLQKGIEGFAKLAFFAGYLAGLTRRFK